MQDMCEFRRVIFALVFARFVQGGLFLLPCSEIFNPQDNFSARLAFENDLTRTIRLELKVAIAANESIKITKNTPYIEVLNGKKIVFDVQFPQNQSSESTIPTPIAITFNEKLYCDDPVPSNTPRLQTFFYESVPLNGHLINERSWQSEAIIQKTETTSEASSWPKRKSRESPWQLPSLPTTDSSECGIKREYTPLILGGNSTKEGEYPWLVALFYSDGANYNYRCAGTLISNRHVITAAHCVNGHIDRKKLYAVFGTQNIEYWVLKSIYRNADKIIVHHEYVNVSIADVAVIIIDAPVPFSELIKPACLWDEPIDVAHVIGEKGNIAGWGADESGNLVHEARQIEIPIVGEVTCLRSNLNFHSITSSRTFCAGERDGRIPCKGDSGSGFVMKRQGRWKLRGIVSSALSSSRTASCDGSHYAVFTDVPQFTTWLTSILKEGTSKVQPSSRAKPEMKIICYFLNWALHRKGAAKFLPEDIDGNLCTHIIYAFAILDENSLTIKPLDEAADIEQYKKVISYQTKGIKVLIALGGWDDSIGDKYSRLVNDSAARAKFIAHVIKFIETWGFDGLDLQWLYPKCWRAPCVKGPDSDKRAFAQFVKELHESFAPRNLLLSAAVALAHEVINPAYDVPVISKYLDWIGVLYYDYPGGSYKQTSHIAPLYYYPGDTYDTVNIFYAVNHWIKFGADPKKLMMGMPQYGRSFTLADPNENGLNSKATGPGIAGEFTTTPGFLAFYEICTRVKHQNWSVVRDPQGRIGPYAFKGNQWVGYDDIAEIKRKSQFIKDKELGGGLVWSLDSDDFRNSCGCGPYPLLKMMNYELRDVPLEHIDLQNCT